jgi:hypothetical protein
MLGGRGGIRTHERLAPLPVFKTGALNHSATLPDLEYQRLVRHLSGTSGESAAGLLPYRSEVRQSRVDRIGRLIIPPPEQMRINLERDRGRGVPEPLANRHVVYRRINEL